MVKPICSHLIRNFSCPRTMDCKNIIFRILSVPNSFKKNYPDIPWKNIAGFRDILSHAYFGVNIDRIWNVIEKDLNPLKKKIEGIKIKDLDK